MDPLSRLKTLPWQPLFLAGLLNGAIALATLLLVRFAVGTLPWLYHGAVLLAEQRLIFPFFLLLCALGWGALGVVLVEQFFPRVPLNASTLWALILCLAVAGWAEQQILAMLIPGTGLLLSWIGDLGIAVIVGVFWHGQRYWRY